MRTSLTWIIGVLFLLIICSGLYTLSGPAGLLSLNHFFGWAFVLLGSWLLLSFLALHKIYTPQTSWGVLRNSALSFMPLVLLAGGRLLVDYIEDRHIAEQVTLLQVYRDKTYTQLEGVRSNWFTINYARVEPILAQQQITGFVATSDIVATGVEADELTLTTNLEVITLPADVIENAELQGSKADLTTIFSTYPNYVTKIDSTVTQLPHRTSWRTEDTFMTAVADWHRIRARVPDTEMVSLYCPTITISSATDFVTDHTRGHRPPLPTEFDEPRLRVVRDQQASNEASLYVPAQRVAISKFASDIRPVYLIPSTTCTAVYSDGTWELVEV